MPVVVAAVVRVGRGVGRVGGDRSVGVVAAPEVVQGTALLLAADAAANKRDGYDVIPRRKNCPALARYGAVSMQNAARGDDDHTARAAALILGSLTSDRGKALRARRFCKVATGIPVYFADRIAPGSAPQTRTPTGSCASTSARAPTSRRSAEEIDASPAHSTLERLVNPGLVYVGLRAWCWSWWRRSGSAVPRRCADLLGTGRHVGAPDALAPAKLLKISCWRRGTRRAAACSAPSLPLPPN